MAQTEPIDQVKNVGAIIRKAENDYITGETTISKYVSFSMYENIEKIDAYLNSKFTTGDTDSLGREKPFFNIVTAAVNIWMRATNIDRKDIHLKATKQSDTMGAFLMTAKLQEWMKREKFGEFLKDWGRSLARYGSSVVKFVEVAGKLHIMVVPWNRIIVDSVDFDNNVKIEILWYTEAQLRQNKAYDQDVVESLCNAITARETMGRNKKDNKNDYIKVYELHGKLSMATLKQAQGVEPDEISEDDNDNFVQQMHVLSFVAGTKKNQFQDFTLMSGKERVDPYMITHLIREDGRTQSIGAVEHLFDAQWMVNHTAKQIKDQLDLASKVVFQTADGSFVDSNVLTSFENGDIMIHADQKPLTQLPNNSHDITSLENFNAMWKNIAQDITSTSNAIAGNDMPSGAAYRQVAILNQESHSLFELMTENKGLSLEDMIRERILPFIKRTQLANSNEIATTLDDYGVQQIQQVFIKSEAASRRKALVKHALLTGDASVLQALPSQQDMQAQVSSELDQQGSSRYFSPDEISTKQWKHILSTIESDVEVEITDETGDKEATLTTLTTVLQTLAVNPQVLSDPNAKLIFNKILEQAGSVSPVELSSLPPTPAAAPAAAPAPALQQANPLQPQFAAQHRP